jgi:hypothetical protein
MPDSPGSRSSPPRSVGSRAAFVRQPHANGPADLDVRHRPLVDSGQRHLLDHAALGAATSQPSSLPQLWIRVKVVPHLPGSANSASASRRSDASSSSLSLSSRRDSSATLN